MNMLANKSNKPETIFVFGSNLAGKHGAGSARKALMFYGAVRGEGVGFHGHSYAIPTKDENLHPLPLYQVWHYVGDFISFVNNNPRYQYKVVAVGCGLAGFTVDNMALMFEPLRHKPNVQLPKEFLDYYVRDLI